VKKPPKILIVEDDRALQELLRHNLEEAGWEVTVADSGETALLQVVDLQPEMILLDLMLPGMGGKQVCRQVRSFPKTSEIPIIMISALRSDTDVIGGLELGADDYVVKPFSPDILLAKIQAVMRRSYRRITEDETAVISVHNLEIDPLQFSVKVDGEPVSLTHIDFMILKLLAEEPGRVHTRRKIIDAVHDREVDIAERSVDVQIVGLRRKLGSAGKYIETVRGVGYRLKKI
jgi:two-component system phosphate regulon response regulator PhoB